MGSADAITITNTDLLFEPGAATITATHPTGNVSWTLLDLSGNIVVTGTVSGTNGSINLNSMPAGYYRLALLRRRGEPQLMIFDGSIRIARRG